MSEAEQKMAPEEGVNGDEKHTSCVTPLKDFKFPEKKKEEKTEQQKVYNSAIMPVISLKQGLGKKATPLALSSWVKLALTLDGRDKITKVCQYTSRMLAWWFAGTNQMKRLKALQDSLTTSRKAFRLGRSLIEIQKIRDSGFVELFFGREGGKPGSSPAWKIIGDAMKMIGLMGFWAGDNVNFLSTSGLFDDYRPEVSHKERVAKRNQLKTNASFFANRFYFFGAIAGLITGLRAYWSFRQTKVKEAHDRLQGASTPASENGTKEETTDARALSEAQKAMDHVREKQFVLFLTVLKVSLLFVMSLVSGILKLMGWLLRAVYRHVAMCWFSVTIQESTCGRSTAERRITRDSTASAACCLPRQCSTIIILIRRPRNDIEM